MRTYYPTGKEDLYLEKPEDRLTLPSIEEIPGHDEVPRLTQTSMAPSEPMLAEVVLKEEQK